MPHIVNTAGNPHRELQLLSFLVLPVFPATGGGTGLVRAHGHQENRQSPGLAVFF
jgi:hypothetical protein